MDPTSILPRLDGQDNLFSDAIQKGSNMALNTVNKGINQARDAGNKILGIDFSTDRDAGSTETAVDRMASEAVAKYENRYAKPVGLNIPGLGSGKQQSAQFGE